jgi:hypothetical protein
MYIDLYIDFEKDYRLYSGLLDGLLTKDMVHLVLSYLIMPVKFIDFVQEYYDMVLRETLINDTSSRSRLPDRGYFILYMHQNSIFTRAIYQKNKTILVVYASRSIFT